MRKGKLIIIFICISTKLSFAQIIHDSIFYHSATPYKPKSTYQTWGIKGKVLPFPNGNGLGINSLLGAEFGFKKNHSIGIDLYMLYLDYIDDHIYDTAGVYHDAANVSHSLDKAIFLNYRYYFNFPKLREEKGISFYTGCFARYGKYTSQENQLFPTTTISDVETHQSIGILIGMLNKFMRYKKYGYDFNFGFFYKQKYINTIYKENNIIKSKNESPSNFGIRVGLNLYWWFYRK